jgi:8-oxo-dGTP diphosphatase
MSEEFLDIVDENNELTGERELRSKVHAEGIWHRTVHIYLFRRSNDAIEFLVHLRSPFKDLRPNCWDTRFGGHIQSGSTLEKGVRAELKEEIGLDVDKYKLLEGFWRKSGEMPNQEFSKIYFLEYTGDVADLKFNDGEVQEVKWLSIQSIKDSMINNLEQWAPGIKGFTEISDYLLKKISV